MKENAIVLLVYSMQIANTDILAAYKNGKRKTGEKRMKTAWKMKKHSGKRFRMVTAALVVVMMIILFFMQLGFQLHEKKRGAERSAEILLSKVEDMLTKN